MATINLSITVPDAQLPRVQDAARATFGQVEDPPASGIFRDMTNAEIVARIRDEVILMIKGLVKRHERNVAIQAAEALDPVVDAT